MLAEARGAWVRSATRVLLVEDHPEVARAQAMLLRKIGYEVEVAQDGYEALSMARMNVPDIALLDIGLPGLDGYEVAAALKADEETRSIRLIALTAYGTPDDQRRSRELGFEAHLVKPATLDQLKRALEGEQA